MRAADTETDGSTVDLRVTLEIPAGSLQTGSIRPGEAAHIMTGAPIPEGADVVVPFEETSSNDGIVSVPSRISPGQCVRPAGLDTTPGQVCLEAGVELGPRQIALCASIGVSSLSVHRRPVIAVLTTGDELVEPGRELNPGQIFNSNSYGLAAAVERTGALARVMKPVADDPTALRDILESIEDADLVLTSGGVSVGDYDYVQQVMGDVGRVDFWRIRMRPGKPLMLGRLMNGSGDEKSTMIIGLPGNPTSTMVTFYVLAQPLIRKLMGLRHPLPKPLTAVAGTDLDNRGGRETFFRVRTEIEDGRLVAYLSGGQDSSMLLPLARANALARVASDVERVVVGEEIPVYPLD